MDHLSRSLLNTYTVQPLDRAAHKRKDAQWLTDQLEDERSEFLILDGHNVVSVERQPLVLSQPQFRELDGGVKPSLLGVKKIDGAPVFLINLSEPETALSTIVQGQDNFVESLSLWEVTHGIDAELASMYSHALLLNHWHISTRFCTRCGSGLEVKEGGSTQHCTKESCSHVEFPRINPAVIMRVTKGDKILLARQASWPKYRYSVLAGFVEVGETIEHTVEREVMEEVGVAVEDINYHSSQPWPFPNSLMLGYTAQASSEEFDLEQDDIDHALWLSAEELKTKMTEGSVLPPPALSISHRLICDWFQAETGVKLNSIKTGKLN